MHPAGREKHLKGVHIFERFEQVHPPQNRFRKTASGRPSLSGACRKIEASPLTFRDLTPTPFFTADAEPPKPLPPFAFGAGGERKIRFPCAYPNKSRRFDG
jgi:hypothetical protein